MTMPERRTKDLTEEDVRGVIQNWDDSFCSRDLDRMMSLYAGNVVIFDAIPPFFHIDLAAFRRKCAACLPYFPEVFATESKNMRIAVDHDLGVMHRLLRYTMEDENHPAAQTWLRQTSCRKLTAGELKIFHEHVSLPFDPETSKAHFSRHGESDVSS